MPRTTSAAVAYGVVTKADRAFFPGLKALLRSLSVHGAGAPITVLDCGLTAAQREFCLAVGCCLETVDLRSFRLEYPGNHVRFSTAVYGFVHAAVLPYPVTLHLDADTIVLGPLDDLVQAADRHGLAAVPGHPPRDLEAQIGDESLLQAVNRIVPQVDLRATAFNAGVFAVRRDYYRSSMQATVRALLPLHPRMQFNEQAILNLAAFAANPDEPYRDVGRCFNARARYSRSPETPPPTLSFGPDGPVLEGFGGRYRVLHFCNRPKPWEENYPRSCPGFATWNHFHGDSRRVATSPAPSGAPGPSCGGEPA